MNKSNKKLIGLALLAALSTQAHANKGVNPKLELGPFDYKAKPANSNTQRYIVEFNDSYLGQKSVVQGLLRQHVKAKAHASFDKVIAASVIDLTKQEVRNIKALPFVKSVSIDTIVEPDASWGQDRIDQRSLPLNSSYNPTHTGQGANIYIVDTGIRASHSEFAGRIGHTRFVAGGSANDCHGHGTHVASTAAGRNYGAAPQARIHSIRISYSCAGKAYSSAQVAAMEWLADNAQPNSVVNFSYEASHASVKIAIDRLVRLNHVVVASAGNDDEVACTANSNKGKPISALLVGSTTSSDSRSSFSNHGTCVNIFAPGSNITAASHTGDNSYTSKSGTSMASPLVAGIAAGYRGTYPSHNQYQVMAAVVNSASTGKLSSLKADSPNKLLYSNTQPSSRYWYLSDEIQVAPFNTNGLMPPSTCTAGQYFPLTVGETGYGMFYQRMWKCN